MASTNKTTNYELSQFIGADKPAWLSDYNSDMNKIDGGIHNAQTTATGADGKADANATAIGTLANLTTTEKTSLVGAINEVDGNADTAQNTATNAVNAGITNAGKIAGLESYLNINTFDTATVSATGATVDTSRTSLKSASNSDGSLGKIYGRIWVTSNSSSFTLTFPTLLRPDSAITIDGIALGQWADNSSSFTSAIGFSTISVATDGTATITTTGTTSGRIHTFDLVACLIFAKSFGDTPQNQ